MYAQKFTSFLQDLPFIIVSLKKRDIGQDRKSADEEKHLMKKIAIATFLGNITELSAY